MSLVFNDIPFLANLRLREVMTQNGENLTRFCFCFILELSFYVKGSQPRIYADLLRFHSRVKDRIQITILMEDRL